MRLHPYELIKSEQWAFGLFTSFTLNLGFFETVVYDAWRARNSRELILVVDRKGYSQSLADHRAAGAGQRYRIVPVVMSDGVFHPKIGFFANDKHAILMVGSGNLTFGGWGKNLELLDVIDSATALRPFVGFQDFLKALDARRRDGDLTVPDTEWIATALSKIPNTAGVDTEGPIFLHSLRDSISAQLKGVINHRKVKRLTVLSPYHDDDGATIDALAMSLNAGDVSIVATNGPTGPVSSFPFRTPLQSNIQSTVLSLDDKRPVHAKWIEIEHDNGVLTLTGSVNATRPALGSKRNAEAGILRQRSAASAPLLSIKPCSIPIHQSSSFGDETAFTGNVVYVLLEASNQLRGKILGSNAGGDWESRIVRPGGAVIPSDHIAPIVIAVDRDGIFVSEVARFTNQGLEFEPGLQLHMVQGKRFASGWIQSDLALRSSSLSRLANSVVGLFQSSGVSTELREFVVEVLKCMKNGLPASEVAPQGDGKKTSEVGFGSKPTSQGTNRASSQTDLIAMLFARLGEDLTRSKSSRDIPRTLSDFGDDATEGDKGLKDASSRSRLNDDIELSLEDMHERMEVAARSLARSDPLCSTLLVIWFDCALNVYLRSGDWASATSFLRRWTGIALSRQNVNRSKPIERGLRRFLMGLQSDEHAVRLKLLLITALTIEARLDRADGDLTRLRRSHEYLEDYFHSDKDIDPAFLPDSTSELISQMLVGDQRNYRLLLAEILQVETRRSMLSSAINRLANGSEIIFDESIFSSLAARELLRRTQENRETRIEQVDREVQACPKCHMSLSPVLHELHRDLLAVCSSCRVMLVRTIL